MLFAAEKAEAFHARSAQAVDIQHAFDGQFQHFGGILFKLAFERGFFGAFGIAGVGEINFFFKQKAEAHQG